MLTMSKGRTNLKHPPSSLMASLMSSDVVLGYLARNIYAAKGEAAAATKIQAGWRMFKTRSAFRHCQLDITTIKCLWRIKLAKRQFTKLKKEANETGALLLAKSKLEKQQEDLMWRQLGKKIRVDADYTKRTRKCGKNMLSFQQAKY
ncbi:myosin-15 isoform X1 [Tanacetum coccineum]